jgi:hypothetical protein
MFADEMKSALIVETLRVEGMIEDGRFCQRVVLPTGFHPKN